MELENDGETKRIYQLPGGQSLRVNHGKNFETNSSPLKRDYFNRKYCSSSNHWFSGDMLNFRERSFCDFCGFFRSFGLQQFVLFFRPGTPTGNSPLGYLGFSHRAGGWFGGERMATLRLLKSSGWPFFCWGIFEGFHAKLATIYVGGARIVLEEENWIHMIEFTCFKMIAFDCSKMIRVYWGAP